MTTSNPSDSILVLGGGIIGLSTAYYLTLHNPDLAHGSKLHIIDTAPSLLLSASGFAGGFIAKDWFSAASADLGALSFRLHRELADAHDGKRKWGYARCTAYSLSVDEYGMSGEKKKWIAPGSDMVEEETEAGGDEWMASGNSRSEVATKNEDSDVVVANGEGAQRHEMLNDDGTPAWMTRQEGGTLEVIGSEGSCAQVEPKEMCAFLIHEIESRGVQIHLSTTATSIVKDEKTGTITGLNTTTSNGEKSTIPCKTLILTAGAWTTPLFKRLFPSSPLKLGITPLAGYSIVVRSPRYSKPIIDPSQHTSSSSNPDSNNDNDSSSITRTCHSVFCPPTKSWPYAPEAISRMTQSGRPEIYVAGLNDPNMSLPLDVTGVKGMIDPEKLRDLKKTTVSLTGLSREGEMLVEDDLEVVREGLCLRPVSRRGVPVVMRVSGRDLGWVDGGGAGGGVYVAAGHGPWGISLSLGTGLVVSEMVLGRKVSADVRGLRVR